MTDVLGIKRLGSVNVISSFNDCPTIGKDAKLMSIRRETKHELVEGNGAFGHACQVLG